MAAIGVTCTCVIFATATRNFELSLGYINKYIFHGRSFFSYANTSAFENMTDGDVKHAIVPRVQAAFHHSKIKMISSKYQLKIMEYLVDTSFPKAEVLIFSTSLGDPDRTSYAYYYTQPRLMEYAKKQRYKVRIYTKPVNSTYYPQWQKLIIFRYLLSGGTNASFIAYFDDDIMLTNLSVRIENYFSLVYDPENIHFIGSRDSYVNNYKYLINTGTMFLRNSKKSLEFVKYALKLHEEIPYIQRNALYDQEAVIVAVWEFFHNHTLLLPMCLIQSLWSTHGDWYQWRPGHFALHHLWSLNIDRSESFARIFANATKWWQVVHHKMNFNCTDETVYHNFGKSEIPLFRSSA